MISKHTPMREGYLETMGAHIDEGGRLNHQNGVDLYQEVVRLRDSRARLVAALGEARAAFDEIMQGNGAFSRDPLVHASNVIDETKAIARSQIATIDIALFLSKGGGE